MMREVTVAFGCCELAVTVPALMSAVKALVVANRSLKMKVRLVQAAPVSAGGEHDRSATVADRLPLSASSSKVKELPAVKDFGTNVISTHWIAGVPAIGFTQFGLPLPLLPFSTWGAAKSCGPVVASTSMGVLSKRRPRGSASTSATMYSSGCPPAPSGKSTVIVTSFCCFCGGLLAATVALAAVLARVRAAGAPPPALAVTFGIGLRKPL